MLTLDVQAITSQAIAVGLVENPLRDFLIEEASKVPAGQAIIECGSYMGRSAGHLALGSHQGNKVPVHAYDPWELAGELPKGYIDTAPSVAEYNRSQTREAFEAHMRATGAHHYVTAHQMGAVQGAQEYDGPPVALLFSDALHDLKSVRDDTTAWLPHMADRAVIVFHDVGDPQYQVEAGARAALTKNKALREKWDFEGRETRLWAKNPEKRGFLIVRTKA